jgi:RimJ/RimL family protein N-acetyltransferase
VDGSSTSELLVRLEGRLVTLEPLSLRHEDDLFEVGSDPEVWRWLAEDAGDSRERFHGWLRRALEAAQRGDEAPYAIVARDSGRAVGSTRFHEIRLEHKRLEIGWTWLAKERWRTGANVESKLLLLEHAFTRLECRRVEFKTDARNARSRAALEAIPAQFEGVFRRHMLVKEGQRRDSAYYSVIDDEWPDVRANLKRRLATKLAVHPNTSPRE